MQVASVLDQPPRPPAHSALDRRSLINAARATTGNSKTAMVVHHRVLQFFIPPLLLTQIVIDDSRRSDWMVQLLEHTALTNVMDAWDLYSMLDSSDGFYLGDLTGGTTDPRPSVRILTASMFVTALEQYASCFDSITSRSSHQDLLMTIQYCRVAEWHGSTVDQAEATRRCHIIVSLLERMSNDTEPTIRSIVTH